MDMVNGVEQRFRALHDASVEKYQQRVKLWQDRLGEQRKRAQADEAEIRESLKKSGTDLDLLDRRAKRAAEATQAQLKTARKELINRADGRMADFKQRGLDTGLLSEIGAAQVSPYAVSLMASDAAVLEGVEGVGGNGWIFPADPSRIKLKDDSDGDGWGCWATASGPPPTATIWFTFVPDQTARYEISPIVAFHGFYVMRADDGIFTCKVAKARLHAKVNIHQYFWMGEKTYKLIDEDDDDVDKTEFYDRTHWLWDTVNLRAGDEVWVKVDVSVNAVAAGGGSYAEVNFSDGNANYIEPLFMTAQVV